MIFVVFLYCLAALIYGGYNAMEWESYGGSAWQRKYHARLALLTPVWPLPLAYFLLRGLRNLVKDAI